MTSLHYNLSCVSIKRKIQSLFTVNLLIICLIHTPQIPLLPRRTAAWSNKLPIVYAEALWNMVLRCDRVYYILRGIIFPGFLKSICHSMCSNWVWKKTVTPYDSVGLAMSWNKPKSGSWTTKAPQNVEKSERHFENNGWSGAHGNDIESTRSSSLQSYNKHHYYFSRDLHNVYQGCTIFPVLSTSQSPFSAISSSSVKALRYTGEHTRRKTCALTSRRHCWP